MNHAEQPAPRRKGNLLFREATWLLTGLYFYLVYSRTEGELFGGVPQAQAAEH